MTGRPQRIAYVLATSTGGTGAHVAMLAAEAGRRGIPVTVFGPAQAGRRFFGLQAPAFAAVDIADRPRPGRDLAAILRLRRLLRRYRPTVVHAHGLRAGAITALALAGWRRPPGLLVTVHNAPMTGGAAPAVSGVLERIVARRAAAVTWVSGDLGARMRHRGARDAGRALVPAPPGGPPSAAQLAQARQDLGAAGGPVVFAAGRLAPQKGFDVLLAAATRWQDRVPVPLVVIAGEGPLAEPLARQAGASGLAVRFLGQRGDVPALLAAADVAVVPSRWEGQPLIVQEALRAGTPLVASRTGGIPELTGEDGALLVPAADPAALAGAVRSLLDDPGLASRLRAAGLRRAAALPSPGTAFDAAAVVYRRLGGQPGPAAGEP